MIRRGGKTAANRVSNRSPAKLSTSQSTRHPNSLGCSRVLYSKPLITSCIYCQLAKQRSKSQASSRSGRRNLLSTESLGFLLPRRRFGSIIKVARLQACRVGSLPFKLRSKKRYLSCRKPSKLQTTFGRSASRARLHKFQKAIF